MDISQCTHDFIDDLLKGAPLTRGFTGADLSEMGPWMMRSYPKEVSSLVSLTAGSGSLRFLYFSVGFSLLLMGIQELEASGLLLQVTLNLLPRKISAFYEFVPLPYWTPKHHFIPRYKRILNMIILFCLGTHVRKEYVNCILCLVNFL